MCGLHALFESGFAVERIGGRRLQLIAQTQVQGQSGVNAVIVLYKQGAGPEVIQCSDRRILIHGDRQTGNEVGQGIAGLCSSEGEDTVVIQQGLLDVLIEGEFAAKLHAVAAMYVADLVAGEIEVSAGNRSGNSLRKREVTGYRDLGQRGGPCTLNAIQDRPTRFAAY